PAPTAVLSPTTSSEPTGRAGSCSKASAGATICRLRSMPAMKPARIRSLGRVRVTMGFNMRNLLDTSVLRPAGVGALQATASGVPAPVGTRGAAGAAGAAGPVYHRPMTETAHPRPKLLADLLAALLDPPPAPET